MSWEAAERLPGAHSDGAFRSSAEPVIAERRGLRPLEWLRTYWRSTPELPFSRVVQHIVLTPQYVYVRRRDGTLSRVPRDRLHGERRERGQVVYGVYEGEDLLLSDRPGCAVQSRLSEQTSGGASVASSPWTSFDLARPGMLLSLMTGFFSAVLLSNYPLARTLDYIEAGFATSETALGTYLGLGMAALTVALWQWSPSRWHVDRVGLTRRRGLIPWLSFEVPPERIDRVLLTPISGRYLGERSRRVGWTVSLLFRSPTRVGTLFNVRQVTLCRFNRLRNLGDVQTQWPEHDAEALASRLRGLLDLAETERGPRRRSSRRG
ncbi:MAG TPA: hypothetical protein ENK57_10390 [Polyangiaceae bacterium]|nr:hypothetical protein [Polyangiaceae bacterium]